MASETWKNASVEKKLEILNEDMTKAFDGLNQLQGRIQTLTQSFAEIRVALAEISKEVRRPQS